MPAAVAKLIGNHNRQPAEQWVKWVSDLYFAPQTPGIMRSRRTAVGSAPRRCTA
jgi:hypothetical protein